MAVGKTRKSHPVEPAVTTTTVATISVPLARPRNRLAVDPLLKKSGAHVDKRKRVQRDGLSDAQRDIAEVFQKRPADES